MTTRADHRTGQAEQVLLPGGAAAVINTGKKGDAFSDFLTNPAGMCSQTRPIVSSICQRECPSRWCCSVRYFSPPPVSPGEIRQIAQTGAAGFYQRTGTGAHLNAGPDGYCIFFDSRSKICNIYPVRPLDCRLFPFDFFAAGPRLGNWVIWDCPYSRQYSEAMIAGMLQRFESDELFVRHIIDTWDYGTEDYHDSLQAAHSPVFRILRRMNVTP